MGIYKLDIPFSKVYKGNNVYLNHTLKDNSKYVDNKCDDNEDDYNYISFRDVDDIIYYDRYGKIPNLLRHKPISP